MPFDLTPIDILGICGSLLIAAAYFAVSNGKVSPERAPFHLINLAGAALILLSLWYRPNPGAIVIEVLWSIIALAALFRLAFRKAD